MLENSRLLRPLGYLKISENKDSSGDTSTHLVKINWGYPVVASTVSIIYFIIHPKIDDPFKPNELFDCIKQFLQILPGFYIAALAAIATFNKPSLDELLDTPLSITTKEHGKVAARALTRRHFLCYLFGYLSFLSIILCLIHSILINASPAHILKNIVYNFFIFVDITLSTETVEKIFTITNFFLLYIFLIFFFQLITITSLGLFYLSDRLHWDNKFTIPKGHWKDTASQQNDDDEQL